MPPVTTESLNPAAVFIKALNQSGIRYMVTGSVAASIYGEPRLTHDLDLVLQISATESTEFIKLFPESNFYCPPIEVFREEISRPSRGHINIIDLESGYKADIYFSGSDSFRKWGLDNAREIDWQGLSVSIAPPEYVIIRKLEFFKEGGSSKHLRDIEFMLKASPDLINFQLLTQFLGERGLLDVWGKVRR